MVRLFDRNMFIMLIAIMVGIVIITYFIADIQRRTQIDTLTVEHATQIVDITNKNQNFTDHFLQGSLTMDAAREQREISNYYFDFGLFWYQTALQQDNETYLGYCVMNCSQAMDNYLISYEKFEESKPYFLDALTFTDIEKYIEIIGYYLKFAEAGMNITLLRYDASKYLMYVAQNLSLGNTENASAMLSLFNETVVLYQGQVGAYDELKGQIDEYTFFDPIREPH